MKYQFIEEALKPADILVGCNLVGAEGKGIRAILGSSSTHNAMIIKHNVQGFSIGDMTPPYSRVVPLAFYANKVNSGSYLIRIWRVRDMSDEERLQVSFYWQMHCEHILYSGWSVKRCWVFRFVNSLPYKIKGEWCTRLLGQAFAGRHNGGELILPPERNPFRKPPRFPGDTEIRIKKNETPRTPEKRLVTGILEDVTPEVFRATA